MRALICIYTGQRDRVWHPSIDSGEHEEVVEARTHTHTHMHTKKHVPRDRRMYIILRI